MGEKIYTLRIDEELFNKVKESADKNCRSVAKQIEFILQQHYSLNTEPQNAYNSPEVDEILNKLFRLLKKHKAITAELKPEE